jgi:D-lactate dehydrogenase (cytochrome)
LIAQIVGHVGNGNIYLLLLVDPDDEDKMTRVNALNERLVHRALAMGGTSTGEPGIGYGKVVFVTAEHGDAISVMRAIKKALDPDTIMNPGKVFRM